MKLRRGDLAFFQFLLEGYQRMVRVTTVDAKAAIVMLSIMPDYVEECTSVVESLAADFDATWIGAEEAGKSDASKSEAL